MGFLEEIEGVVAEFEKVCKPAPLKKTQQVTSFDLRRQKDPQGLIDDLLSQIKRQAKTIHKKNKEIESLKKD